MVHLKRKIVGEIKPKVVEPAKKSIEFLVAFHKSQRPGLVSEVFDDILGEYGNLPVKLERYGENSNFWKAEKEFKYSNAKGKRPSAAWLRTKVKCYESQATKQNTER